MYGRRVCTTAAFLRKNCRHVFHKSTPSRVVTLGPDTVLCLFLDWRPLAEEKLPVRVMGNGGEIELITRTYPTEPPTPVTARSTKTPFPRGPFAQRMSDGDPLLVSQCHPVKAVKVTRFRNHLLVTYR